MKILVIKVDLRAPYAHSLKEKRMIVKSIIGKLQNKFNISIREVEKIYNYLLAEEKFNIMMDSINKIIAQAIKEDYK